MGLWKRLSNKEKYIMEKKIEMAITQTHINTLQNIIARHANYSVNCKTWCITIITALCIIFFEKTHVLMPSF